MTDKTTENELTLGEYEVSETAAYSIQTSPSNCDDDSGSYDAPTDPGTNTNDSSSEGVHNSPDDSGSSAYPTGSDGVPTTPTTYIPDTPQDSGASGDSGSTGSGSTTFDGSIGEEGNSTPKNPKEGSVADPVDVSEGAHTLTNTVMTIAGGQGLALKLNYHSRRLDCDSLGKGWYHNYEKRIEFCADEAYVYSNPAIYARYTRNADGVTFSCATAGKLGYTLTVDTAAEYPYILDCNKTKTEYYGYDGKLAKIVDHNGFETTIMYEAYLVTITDTVSDKHIFLQKNDNGKIVRVYDDISREASLEYSNGCLVTIRDANCNCLYFTYDSEGRVLTGTDDTGVRYFEDTYDADGRVVSQKDGNGSAPTILEYFDDGTRRVTNRNGDISTRIFNEDGLLVSYTDENGNTKTYEYDDNHNITKETNALGNSVITEYNSNNKPIKVTKKNGVSAEYEYDTNGNLVRVTYPDHEGEPVFETYAYNSRNQIVMHTDVRGTVIVYTYDANGMPATKKVGDKNAIKYSYNNGQLVSETDTLGNTTRYEHNSVGFVTTKIDAHGNRTTFEYDNLGNVLRMTAPDGSSISYSYDAIYQKTAHTDANGNTTYYSYTGNMKPSCATLPNGSTTRYEYDGEDRIIKITDRDGTSAYTYYDPAGRPIAKYDHEGNVTSFEYDALGNVVKVINPNCAETINTYDSEGNLIKSTDNNGNSVTYQYDNMSRVIRKIDALTGVTVYRYSKAGDLLSETDALGNTRSYTYDGYGNRLTACDANGNVTSFIYDDNNNMIATIDALGNVTKYAYSCLNQLIRVTNAKGQTVRYIYDALGRQIEVVDAKGNSVRKAYDANGNVISITDAKGNVVSETAYNELNLPSEVSYISGNTVTYEYDSIGRATMVTDALCNTKQYMYNYRGQNTAVIDAAGNTSSTAYDVLGNRTAIVGPLGGATRYTYDVMGRLTSETTTSGGSVRYTYNALNLKSSLTNARGQRRSFTYDALGRIIGCTSADDSVSYTYDANGNVLTSTDKNGTIKRKIDALNRVIEYEDTFGNIIGYRYDPVGNLVAITYPDGTEVSYEYDVNNNLVSVTDWGDRKTVYTYDENNRVTGVIKPDGSVTVTEYDNAGRVISTVEKNASGVLITGFEYTYDILGRVSTEKYLDKNIQMCYTYDERSRVTQRVAVNYNTGETIDETFTYDAAGNIISATDDCCDTDSFSYDANNRLTYHNGMSVTYDADGNMTSAYHDGSRDSFRYDSTNRLIGTNTNAYTYNAENVRIRNLCGDSETTYVYNTNAKLSSMLMKITNGVVTKYVYGRGLIGEETNGVFKTYHFDYRGSTVAITDINGNVTDTFEYDTYGKLINRTGNSDVIFLYNGRDGVVTDSNGLIYMRARYYSPELRRFINADTLAGDIANAVTLNRYAYANANPVSFVDPRGLSADRRGGSSLTQYKTLGNEHSWHKDNNTVDIEYLKELFNDINALNAKSSTAALLEETLAEINEYIQSYSISGKHSMTAIVSPNTTLSFEFDLTSGDGNIDIASISLDQLHLLNSISYELFDNTSISVGRDGVSVEYSHDIDEDTYITASVTGSLPKSVTLAWSVSTRLEAGITASMQIGLTHIGNSNYSDKQATNNGGSNNSSKTTHKNNNTVAKVIGAVGAGILVGVALFSPIPGDEIAATAALGVALA